MATHERDERNAGQVHRPRQWRPRDTDHPTGSTQAADNAATDPPS
jgi:hypothetical protein